MARTLDRRSPLAEFRLYTPPATADSGLMLAYPADAAGRGLNHGFLVKIFFNSHDFAKKVGERIGSFLDYLESCETNANASLRSAYIKNGHAREAEVLAKMPKFGPNADWASRSHYRLLSLETGLFVRAAAMRFYPGEITSHDT